MKYFPLLPLCCLLLSSGLAHAWWDTRLEATRPGLPATQEFPAATGGEGTPDAQADGGKGGRVLPLRKGGKAISQTVTLKPGLYSWSAICRLIEEKTRTPLFRLTLSRKGQELERWLLPGRVGGFYGAVTFYLPIREEGSYTLSLALEGSREELLALAKETRPDGSTVERFEEKEVKHLLRSIDEVDMVLVDRFELAGTLAPGPLRQRKKSRNLAPERAAELLELASLKPRRKGETKGNVSTLWDRLPGYNRLASENRDSFGGYRMNSLKRAVNDYLESGKEEDGLYAALMLCGLAEKWPAVQYSATYLGGHAYLSKESIPPWLTNTANMVGKTLYRGWSPGIAVPLIVSYDVLFDFIAKNPELLARVREKLPSIRTHDDLIAFLDERLLWCSARDCRRGWISSDALPPLIAEVFGPGPEADAVLSSTIFDRIQTNMTHLGGIDDQAVTSYNRDGVHYISSAVYFAPVLGDLAGSLAGYRKLGGDPAFDLYSLPGGRNAALNPYTLEAIHVAGGFLLMAGDGGSYKHGRKKPYHPHPSRVLGGTGYTILEAGNEEGDPLKGRALGIYWGGGRGHAHCDTLSIELFAQGSRMAPDLGGRHEGKYVGSPNMRSNRVHNLVEVDDRNFWNKGPSTTPATGWLVSFAPARHGSQFAEHGASAISHPQVKLYRRQTALMSVPGERREESYLFDVFRVRGGKIHSYHFHGGDTGAIRTNVELKPAERNRFLREHKEGSRFEGVAGKIVEVEWPLRPSTQKGYQEKEYEKDFQPVTRLFLLGQNEEPVLIGNAHSKHYQYDYPFFYLRKVAQRSLESVFPAVIEMYAGKPFIREVRPLELPMGDALGPVALEVETTGGRTDFLFASGEPEKEKAIGETRSVTGRFALVAAYGGRLDEARLTGGTRLRTPQIAIEVPAARLQWKITRVDYPGRKLELDKPIPASFRGSVVLINNGSRLHAFNLEAAGGSGVTLKEYPAYYQSNLLRMGADDRTVTGELEAGQAAWDPRFAHNTVLANEDRSRTWRVEAFEDDGHWMTIGYPGYRWSFPIEATLEDFPDLDGDGRRIATLEPASKREVPEYGKLEITQVANQRISFRIPKETPADARIHRGGWAMDGHVLVPEGGKRRFYTRYSGSNMQWRLQSPIAAEDLTDPNGDGKRKLHAYVFGEGDEMEVDASVQVRYDAKKRIYEVGTNTPATIALPAGAPLPTTASYGNRHNEPLKTAARDGSTVIEITPAMVEAGTIRLK